MSSLRPTNHRRRSHSASANSLCNRRKTESLKLGAAKRGRPHSLYVSDFNTTSNPGVWKLRKKRRNTSLSGLSSDEDIHESDHEMDLGTNDCMIPGPHTPTPAFAATSAEFHLFPRSNGRPCHGSHNTAPFGSHSDTPSFAELSRLRSNAFWELQRSVLENGEGLVSRMRDYERTRSRADAFAKVKDAQKRGKKRSSLLSLARREPGTLHDESEEEEDDIQILAGHLPQPFSAREGRHRASSSPETNTGGWSVPSSDRCSSPCSSFYMTDDEPSFTPETNYQDQSSQDSSSLSSPFMTTCTTSIPPSPPLMLGDDHSMATPSIASSRSEKAIAALTLALANGSAGINDYEAIRNLQPVLALDDSQVGDMWH
ncbi:hypothetical protein V5O48_005981 [Marasmius crinis-equi]|uniref:Uncharacterized protein n=1 Tax=Marasmius crinis-equi TaxID=585013 RepID=A0ABR3FKQ8_9AGAR